MNPLQAGQIGLLGLLLYREARGAGSLARLAIAFTVTERTKHGGWWGTDLASVIRHPLQYSSLTAPHDPQLSVYPASDNEFVWLDCLTCAMQALNGSVANPVPEADSYYDDSIAPPEWATDANLIRKIGRLNFHKVGV